MDLPTLQELFHKISLYTKIDMSEIYSDTKGDLNIEKYLDDLCYSNKTIDVFCTNCNKLSTFKNITNRPLSYAPSAVKAITLKVIVITVQCSRNKEHCQFVVLRIFSDYFIKIGQFPSIADLCFDYLNKYNGILNDEHLNNLKRSIGLYSHGIGIGSFVYLRRIFEDLIYNTFDEKKHMLDCDLDNFKFLRMSDKIKTLQKYLPDFVVDNSSLYSILSKGVHSLSEEDCMKHFEVVKIAIELILDEKIELIEKNKKIEFAKKAIQSTHKELS